MLSAPARAQDASENLTLTAGVDVVYDTNVLRGNAGRFLGEGDNVRVTPRLDLAVRQDLGRTQLNGALSAGYDFNSRYGFLDQFRIGASGSARLPLGAFCSVRPRLAYQRYQSDLGDLAIVGENQTQLVSYSVEGACDRPVGFSPYAELTYDRGTNSEPGRIGGDYRTRGGRIGVDYNRPSLGVIRLFGGMRVIERPVLRQITGIADKTTVTQAGVQITRAVAPRLSGTASVSYLNADPDRPGVESYGGLGFSADLTYRPMPDWRFTIGGSRDVTSEPAISATYVLRDQLRADVEWQLTARSSIDLNADYFRRSFRGEDINIGNLGLPPRGSDRTIAFGGRYNYDLRRFRLSLGAGYRDRAADNDFYDYDAFSLIGSIRAKF